MRKTTPAGILTLAFLLVCNIGFSQKLKYKDIYALLSTKQYEQAEPFLRRYLLEKEEPSGYLFRGIIFNDRANKIDVLKQRDISLSLMDSALLFFDKAKATITEKEVRRNKEYYEMYNRRDLRTGEFGVKLSDIQFDIDKRMEDLRARIDAVKNTTHYFELTESLYKKCQGTYAALREKYPSQRALYLRADESTIADLKAIAVRFDSCAKAFEQYRSASTKISGFNYHQEFTPKEIRDYSAEGLEEADFYSDNPVVWNYRAFSEQVVAIVEKEIIPTNESLVAYDIEINKLREKVANDSVSVRSDLTRIIDKLLNGQLKKYDSNPLPLDVFTAKIADLEYRSLQLEHRPFRDSADASLRLSIAEKEMQFIARLDSITTLMVNSDLDERAMDYQTFISNAYGTANVMKSYIATLNDYAKQELEEMSMRLASAKEGLNWIVDGNDSIPLFEQKEGNPYKMLATVEEQYTVGLHFTDSVHATGYFCTIAPTRARDVKVTFPVDKSGFTKGKLASTRALTNADANGQIFFVLISREDAAASKYPSTLAKIYRSDGLAWTSPLSLAFSPEELTVKPDTGEVTVRGGGQEVVIDKNGRPVR